LAGLPGIGHGFFTRRGGCSSGIYRSLNCGLGSADDPGAVAANRARCAAHLGLPDGALATPFQVHGVTVARVDEPWAAGAAPRADALVTSRRGVALGILTADCAPILLVDREAGVIGAAHAGWKGAKAGVTDSVVAEMIALGANRDNIVACVGPAIGSSSYEVGSEFQAGFLADDCASAQFFHLGPAGRPHFDLQAYVAARLGRLGLARVTRIDRDTCGESEVFFSYRRSCLQHEPDYGRQLSAIVLV
jgi:YfiH family protein